MEIAKEPVLDMLINPAGPALSTTNDMPVIETKPDSLNEPVAPAAPSKTEEVKEEAEQLSESATETTEEAPAEPAKKESRGVQKALDRLTAERETEKRRADEEAEKRIRLEERLKVLEEHKAVPAVDEAPVRPSRDDFPDPDDWAQAMVDYSAKNATHLAAKEFKRLEDEANAAKQRAVIEESQKKTREAYNERITKVQEKYPDFKEVAETPDVSISIPLVHAIIHSEHGPELQYYLGKNPAEAARIVALEAPLQLIEAGRIISQLLAPPPKAAVSSAPKPIKPLAQATESTNFDPETASVEEYAAWRKKQAGNKAVRH